jgi:hypothetical protein
MISFSPWYIKFLFNAMQLLEAEKKLIYIVRLNAVPFMLFCCCLYQWPLGLRRGSAAACLLRSWV